MIDIEVGRKLLDFDKRIRDATRAEEQLHGAVAIHNILRTNNFAYLADEVGMGKTYVALGAIALFRHFDPSFRVLVIAPRENIQKKWQKEWANFVRHNVRFSDLRMRAGDGRPVRPFVSCANLLELVSETALNPNREFFARLSSFSLPLGRTEDDWKKLRNALRGHLPWIQNEAFDLRSKHQFKKNFARALCCALPVFDLVIVDEGHNLKHGFRSSSSDRNSVLAAAFGRHLPEDKPNSRLFPGYGQRAKRVLFLSATPLDETYLQIWNQLDLFGHGDGLDELRREDVQEARKKELATQFLVRRVTSLRIAGREYTKNMYRREWTAGGVQVHDEPIRVEDERQRLIVALVQKKVTELLSGKRFNRSFQIGMLASFESFLETAKLKRDDKDDDPSVFDDPDQTDDSMEREGIDVHDLNKLARDYRREFGREMPHPKMDAVADALEPSWETGRKTLIFVRRVASVKELKRKLDEAYDAWLFETLTRRLPVTLHAEFERIRRMYEREKGEADARKQLTVAAPTDGLDGDAEVDDRGGVDTFFAWFFRGAGPKGVISGANIQERFIKQSSAYSTFFSDNHVMALLETPAGGVVDALSRAIGKTSSETMALVQRGGAHYISGRAKKITPVSRMQAAQAAALVLLKDAAGGRLAERAEIIWDERYRHAQAPYPASDAPVDIGESLEWTTFLTELRLPRWEDLRRDIWPEAVRSGASSVDFREQFREELLRSELLASAARLGCSLIDLYVAAMAGRSSMAIRGGNRDESSVPVGREDTGADRLCREYLAILEQQRTTTSPRAWAAYDELSTIAANFELILDVNMPEASKAPLNESARYLGRLLGQQQPVGGMFGQVNQTLVRQFRMPGYPFILITTDLLQEGEDLHTFCSSVMHYGISWTPSAMEQRIGRVDRVRSLTDRCLSKLESEPSKDALLQVYYPYLADTVEVLQVERVLDRMHTFLRLMHEGLSVPKGSHNKVDVKRDIVATHRQVKPILGPLKSAFPVPAWALKGSKRCLAVDASRSGDVVARFEQLKEPLNLGASAVEWTAYSPSGLLRGTAKLESGRRQGFVLVLKFERGHAIVRCISPIGQIHPQEDTSAVVQSAALIASGIGATLNRAQRSYDLTIEDDVLLGDPVHDVTRVSMLVRRVVEQADQMERELFGHVRDEPMQKFQADLSKESWHVE